MKHKVSELDGVRLDAAVAKAEGFRFRIARERPSVETDPIECFLEEPSRPSTHYPESSVFQPSSHWGDAGPIIERERITVGVQHGAAAQWMAWARPRAVRCIGSTPLIAAMRAYVASKLGPEIEL